MEITIPEKFSDLLDQYRYYVYYGGRGSSKSHSIARYLIIKSLQENLKILCTREFQNSITESVYTLLKDIIVQYELNDYFHIKNASIQCTNGSVFIFKGLSLNIQSVKSTEGVDICWVEEADKVSQASWDILIPTIRKPYSKFIITFNPTLESDPVYKMFITNKQHDAVCVKVNYSDNPWFPEVLRKEMEHMKQTDYERYLHVWEGELRTISDAQVFREKYVVMEFDSKDMGIESFFHGMDFGFANDPSAVIRVFIKDRNLYIDDEAFGYGIEINELSHLIRKVIKERHFKIRADCARPETISYLRNEGWNIEAADKWQGSVEDGIEFMRSFEKIIIHPRCVRLIEEFTRYSFKIDKRTNEVLPIVVDEYNHGIDSIRYALCNLIKHRFSIYDDGVM